MKLVTSTILVLLVVFTSGCANMATVANADASAGQSTDFNADYELVKAATLASLKSLNINISGAKETEEGYAITFSKAMSAFSWGEVGRALVKPVSDEKTTVSVYTEKRSKMQITGTDQQTFSKMIFEGVNKVLEQSAGS